MVLLSLVSAADPVLWYCFVMGDRIGLPAVLAATLWVGLCTMYIPMAYRRWSQGSSAGYSRLHVGIGALLVFASLPLGVALVGRGYLWGALVPAVRAALGFWAYRGR